MFQVVTKYSPILIEVLVDTNTFTCQSFIRKLKSLHVMASITSDLAAVTCCPWPLVKFLERQPKQLTAKQSRFDSVQAMEDLARIMSLGPGGPALPGPHGVHLQGIQRTGDRFCPFLCPLNSCSHIIYENL